MGCKRCGNCCKVLLVEMDGIDRDENWVKARGGEVKGKYGVLPFKCRYLNSKNECDKQENGKPSFCKDFPVGWLYDSLEAIGCRYFEE